MSQQALYRKWRSRSFDELIGQPHVVQTLQNALDGNRVAHAYIFSGPRGTGKTSSARILAKAVNCLAAQEERPCNRCQLCQSLTDGSSLDLIEIDAASNTQVDKVRDVIVEKVSFAPAEARQKVYIIDEVHMLSNSAFNALLKTIEEPPAHAMFVLATTEIHKIPATILSRCQRLDFRRINIEDVVGHLRWVLAQENVVADDQVLELVARQATGSMRDALSLLDQLLAHGGTHLTLETAHAALGLASRESIQALVDYLLAQDIGSALKLVNQLFDQGNDPRQFVVDLLEYLRALLLTLAGGNQQLLNLPAATISRLRKQMRPLKNKVSVLVKIIRLFNQAGSDLKLGLQPQLPIELAVIEAVELLGTSGIAPADAPETLPIDEKQRLSNSNRRPSASSITTTETKVAAPVARTTQAPPIVAPPAAFDMSQLGATSSSQTDGLSGRFSEHIPPLPPKPQHSPFEIPPEPKPTIRTRSVSAAPPAPPIQRPLNWWRENWDAFKNFVAKQGEEGYRVSLRLKFCEPYALEEKRLILGFFFSIHMGLVQAPNEHKLLEKALSAFGGSEMSLHCKLTPKTQSRQGKTKYEEAAEDPVVQEVLQKFGGRIVEVYRPKSKRSS